MGSLGNILRREREARGITLEEIAEKTKIGIRLLRAIETEQFDKLPGGLFNKSFVRQYARALGIDETVAVREYLQSYVVRRETPPAPRSRPREQSFSKEADTSRVILAVLGIVILIAGIVYGGYRLYGYVSSRAERVQNRESAAETIPAVIPPAAAAAEPLAASAENYEPYDATGGGPAEPIGGDGQNETAASSGSEPDPGLDLVAGTTAGKPAAAPAAGPPEELALRIDTHGTVWLSITADGVRQWQGMMRANQTREVQAAESVRLTVGDAAAVSLTLNGKSLPGLGQPGEVRNLTITARDAANPLP